ncbi:beta-ketoacyl-ACP synthase III [Candidatus Legionella polyplacis]|uniref:Beta-ketoacyl-[acyl-carrier-protein] synthase III n=1 Tax=Candidatus Legionella polyplacis TaxID=2005262 RepID=A0ABZ2H0H4_9GAMM
MKNVIINGTGCYLPNYILNNKELGSKINTSDKWIYTRTGIKKRHIASNYETTSFMACKAALNALENSNINAIDIDLILVATCTPNYFFPNIASHIQKALNVTHSIPSFDINAACSGFIYAMDIAKQYISSGNAKHILIVGSEVMSKTLNWVDRSTCVLFGDGAGAIILSESNKPGILSSILYTKYDVNSLLMYKNYSSKKKKSFIKMKGNKIFKLSVKIIENIINKVLDSCQLNKTDISWFIPHQSNIRIIQAVAKKLNFPMSQVIITIKNQGNTSAASIPLALDYAIRQKKKIKQNDLLLLESFGGGITCGAMLIRY